MFAFALKVFFLVPSGLRFFGLVHLTYDALAFAAPLVWTGLELLRGYLFTGFSMGLLGHTQFEFPLLIQIASYTGAYGISFLMAFANAALAAVILYVLV